MKDCLFCKIIAREVPAKVVFEDDLLLAFEDINPKAPVHTLIIPKEHLSSLNDFPEKKQDLLARILVRAKALAEEKGIAAKGYRIVLNTGADSGQQVFHIHFHLLGGRPLSWPPG